MVSAPDPPVIVADQKETLSFFSHVANSPSCQKIRCHSMGISRLRQLESSDLFVNLTITRTESVHRPKRPLTDSDPRFR